MLSRLTFRIGVLPSCAETPWVVGCGGSCDGGAPVFYIYQVQPKGLKSLWQYETGSVAYGCGLKSFAVKRGKIRLEIFGWCDRKNRTSDSGPGKFMVQNTTRITFGFNGKKIVEEKRAFIDSPMRDVKNYDSDISIEE